jgi:signal transduction histidine kinase
VLDVTVAGVDGRVSIRVTDTGDGMPPEVLDRVFEPFYSAAKGGTGLGLVIVKNVIEAHRGTLSIDSSVGNGTTITIDLPARH